VYRILTVIEISSGCTIRIRSDKLYNLSLILLYEMAKIPKSDHAVSKYKKEIQIREINGLTRTPGYIGGGIMYIMYIVKYVQIKSLHNPGL
jgi:hypothetical protein